MFVCVVVSILRQFMMFVSCYCFHYKQLQRDQIKKALLVFCHHRPSCLFVLFLLLVFCDSWWCCCWQLKYRRFDQRQDHASQTKWGNSWMNTVMIYFTIFGCSKVYILHSAFSCNRTKFPLFQNQILARQNLNLPNAVIENLISVSQVRSRLYGETSGAAMQLPPICRF